jgi:hypothetical protein
MGKKSRRNKNKGGAVAKQYVPSDISEFGEPPSTESIADFWNWFLQNESTLFEVHVADVRTLNALLDPQLERLKPGLLWEIGHDIHTNKREFVVSAGGFKDLFPAVIATIRAAPTGLEQRWSFIAFRGRNQESFQSNEDLSYCVLYYQGRGYPQHLIRYALTRDERKDKIGVMLFFKDYTEAERDFFMSIGFLYLDAYLGEYDVEMHVGDIQFRAHECEEFLISGGGLPLEEMASEFDRRLADKIGPKPKDGWSALLPNDLKPIIGNNKRAPLSKVTANA